MATCPKCDGEGVVKGADDKEVECPECGGTGEVDATDVKEPPKD